MIMTLILGLGGATGAILGFRHFKVGALAPLIVLIAGCVLANGVAGGCELRGLMFSLLVAVVSPQVGYLLSFMLKVDDTKSAPHRSVKIFRDELSRAKYG